eukprot:CAMPEP_0117473804 /NCGR_PEP_ID=MMETSP0784-20121206/8958_1 /TAXON_ID=39447 /ORGANISM="" /LENGTH=131 /DNA_ID=CAMNT_0005268011 /DNA_START=405 /DNA_END=800 /DNA_ORIENTATION=-
MSSTRRGVCSQCPGAKARLAAGADPGRHALSLCTPRSDNRPLAAASWPLAKVSRVAQPLSLNASASARCFLTLRACVLERYSVNVFNVASGSVFSTSIRASRPRAFTSLSICCNDGSGVPCGGMVKKSTVA